MDTDYKTIKENLINAGVTPHLNIFFSIEMGLQGTSWNEITANEKNEIQTILGDVFMNQILKNKRKLNPSIF